MSAPDNHSRRPVRPIRLVPEASGRPKWRRRVLLIVAGLALLAAAVLFPRLLAFVELGARELRYFWWLVLLLALGVWLAFFFGRKRE